MVFTPFVATAGDLPSSVALPFGDGTDDFGGVLDAGPGEDPIAFRFDSSFEVGVNFGDFQGVDGIVDSHLVPIDAGQMRAWEKADLDGDGDEDLIITTLEPNEVVLLRQDHRMFSVVGTIPIEGDNFGNVVDPVVGDYNADGVPDIALITHGRDVRVLPGIAPFEFGPAWAIEPQSLQPNAIAANFDGVPGDELIAPRGSTLAVISFNDGEASFTFSPSLGFTPRFLSVRPFRSDGVNEILAAGPISGGKTAFRTLRTLGDSLAVRSEGSALLDSAELFAFADLDGDGLDDLVAGRREIAVFHGMNAPITETPLDLRPSVIGSGGVSNAGSNRFDVRDLDLDGHLDLIGWRRDGFQVIRGDSQRFRTRVRGLIGTAFSDEWLVPYPQGDPMAPGVLVVAAAVRIDTASEGPGITAELDSRLPQSGLSRIQFGDLNGDGITDYCGIARPRFSGDESTIFWALGDGLGTFGPRLYRVILASYGAAPFISDMNGDGIGDVAHVSNSAIRVAFGDASGFLSEFVDYPVSQLNSVGYLVDADADGIADAVRSGEGLIEIAYGETGPAFRDSTRIDVGRVFGDVEFADLNADSILDVVVTTDAGIGFALSRADREYDPVEFLTLVYPPKDVVVGDLDGDRYPEIVALQELGVASVIGFDRDRRLTSRHSFYASASNAMVIDADDDGSNELFLVDDEAVFFVFDAAGRRCPGDHAPDGSVDFWDIVSFVNDLAEQRLYADIDGNGIVNFFDLAMFIDFFGQGCDQ